MDKTDPHPQLPRRPLFERKPVTKSVILVSIPVSTTPANAAPVSKPKVDRKVYMRELMRKKRAAEKGNSQ